MDKKDVSVRIDKEKHQQLKMIHARKGWTVKDLVGFSIDHYLADLESEKIVLAEKE